MRKKIVLAIMTVALTAFTYGCGSEPVSAVVPTDVPEATATAIPTSTPTVSTEVPTNTPEPTEEPTSVPTVEPTATAIPTSEPTQVPTEVPTNTPTPEPTVEPTEVPEVTTTPEPTVEPTATPSPTVEITPVPTVEPTEIPEVTTTPEPTVEPTVTPTPTPRPTPIPGDDVGVEFDGTVTLDCGVEIPKLKDYNTAGIYSSDTKIYGWYGDGQDNRDNSKQLGQSMTNLEKEFGMYDENGKKIAQGFYVGNFSAEFYWDSVGSTPDLALYRDVDNQCYYLAINYDLTEGGTVTPKKARDVLRMLLSICSSNPIELEEAIYNDCYVEVFIPLDEWIAVGDSMVSFETKPAINGRSVYTIKQK